MDTDPLVTLPLPAGPPLHLERAGAATKHLSPFLKPRRLSRMRAVLAGRTRHLTALLERIHDPHNVAACVRSCDAFGIQDLHVVTPDNEPLDVGREISRGAQKWLTIRYHTSTEAAVAALHTAGYRIAATDLGGSTPPEPIDSVPIQTPLCVVFGNEHDGISPTLRGLADTRIMVPMNGFVESLNISVAFAVTLYTLRQRHIAEAGKAGDLSGDEAAQLLDKWVFADVPGARRVIEVLAARAPG